MVSKRIITVRTVLSDSVISNMDKTIILNLSFSSPGLLVRSNLPGPGASVVFFDSADFEEPATVSGSLFK